MENINVTLNQQPKPQIVKPYSIAIASGKGGVGKSTIAAALACLLAKAGYSVGLLDADIYGPTQTNLYNSNQQCQVNEQGLIIPLECHGVHLVSIAALTNPEEAYIIRAPIANRLLGDFLHKVAWPKLDYLILDLPPGTGDIQLTLCQQAQLDSAIVVTTPQKVAYKIAGKSITMFNKLDVPILGIVENMSGFVCSNCNTHHQIFQSGGGDILANKFNTSVIAKIPLTEQIVELSELGAPLATLADDDELLNSFSEILKFILDRDSRDNKYNQLEQKFSYQIINGKQLQIQTESAKFTIDANILRNQCPCAICNQTTNNFTDISIVDAQDVGNYAIKFKFSDGHDTGIFQKSWLLEFGNG